MSIIIITIGIFALLAAGIISLTQRIDMTLLVCLGIALACLIGSLIAVILAKKHIQTHEEKIRLNPYANVDKKEIDKVLDMISREESRRQRSEDFAAGVELSESLGSQPTDTHYNDTADDDELRFLVIDDHEEEEPSEPIPVIGFDRESDEETAAFKEAEIKSDAESDNDGASAYPDIPEEEDDDMNRGYDDYDDRAPRRRSPEGSDRRERDPYYDEYYDERPKQRAPRDMRDQRDARDYRDPYARERDREGVYYNEYGEPVRRRRSPSYDPYYDDYYAERPRQRAPRDMRDQRDMRSSRDPYASRDRDRDRGGVYYNEYGEPVRRRPSAAPYDDRRQPSQRRRRPDGYPETRQQPRYDYEDENPIRTAAPAEPTAAPIDDSIDVIGVSSPSPSAAPKAPDYDENYVPVVIPDDDYDYDSARTSHSGRAGVGAFHRPDVSSTEAAQPAYRNDPPRTDDRRYSSYDEEDSIPVALPDDDYFENRYASSDRDPGYQRDSYRQTPAAPPVAPAEASSGRSRDRYVPDYEEEEMVISLPRDDEYESYLEKKREEEEKKREAEALAEQQRLKEQKKAERIASGKIVLTIVKIRRKKIRRKSRKYKQFRASVHHLNEYLHSFSARGGRS